jgi:CBS domain containing-hemolysin-like protein
VVGFVDVKDVLRATESGESAVTAGDLARDVIVVPEMMAISDLLLQFRADRRQMAVVVDEWGVLEGIATVEDVTEALVGDLRDEFDRDSREHSIRPRDDGEWEADGSVSLSAINDALGTEFEGEGYETLAGLVLDRLGRTPAVGDTLETAEHVIEVTAKDGSRIASLHITSIGGDGDDDADESRPD